MDKTLGCTVQDTVVGPARHAAGPVWPTLRGGDGGRVEASAEHFGQPGGSHAQVATARDLELALDDRESTELRAVDAALARIEAGRYGECADCGADIPAARLLAAPMKPAAGVTRQTQVEAAQPAT